MNEPSTPPRPRPDDANPIPEEAQAVFDTVMGPNLRLSDNMIQLAVIVAGTILSAIGGAVWGLLGNGDPVWFAVVFGFFGVIGSLLLSGAVLGLVRFVTAVRRR